MSMCVHVRMHTWAHVCVGECIARVCGYCMCMLTHALCNATNRHQSLKFKSYIGSYQFNLHHSCECPIIMKLCLWMPLQKWQLINSAGTLGSGLLNVCTVQTKLAIIIKFNYAHSYVVVLYMHTYACIWIFIHCIWRPYTLS